MSVALWRLWKTPGPVVPRTLSTIAMEHDNKLYRLLASLLHHGHHGATHSNPLQPTVLAQHGDGPDEIGICSWCVKQGFWAQPCGHGYSIEQGTRRAWNIEKTWPELGEQNHRIPPRVLGDDPGSTAVL